MSLSLALVGLMAVLYACGVYLMLERSMTRVLLGFLLVGNATNLLILTMGGVPGVAPIVADGVTAEQMSDPLPQALILTAIVITFGVSGFLLALIYRSWRLRAADEVQDDIEDTAVGARTLAVADERSAPDSGASEFAAGSGLETMEAARAEERR